jgi:hypothetical protein
VNRDEIIISEEVAERIVVAQHYGAFIGFRMGSSGGSAVFSLPFFWCFGVCVQAYLWKVENTAD